MLVRIRNVQVRSDERPSKPSIPRSTASQASCTTSSALASVETWLRATRVMSGVQASTSGAEGVFVPRPEGIRERAVVHPDFIAAQHPGAHKESQVRRD